MKIFYFSKAETYCFRLFCYIWDDKIFINFLFDICSKPISAHEIFYFTQSVFHNGKDVSSECFWTDVMLQEREDVDIFLILSSLHSKGKIIIVPIHSHRAILDSHLGHRYEKWHVLRLILAYQFKGHVTLVVFKSESVDPHLLLNIIWGFFNK